MEEAFAVANRHTPCYRELVDDLVGCADLIAKNRQGFADAFDVPGGTHPRTPSR